MAATKRSKILRLKKELQVALKEFHSLPKKSSFSGIHLSEKIDRIQKRLDALGDTSKRHYIEIDIEIG